MAQSKVVGSSHDYIRVRIEGLVNPPSYYENIRFNNTTNGDGSANMNYGGGQASDGSYYTETWVSSGLSPSTEYSFNNSVTTAYQTYWFPIDWTTQAYTVPTPTLYIGTIDSTSVSMSWTSVSDASYYRLANTTTGEVITVYSTSYTWTGLSPNTQYGFRVYAVANGYSSDWSTTKYATTLDNPRPSNWAWYTSKSSGNYFSLTANEWNAFTSKINEFRVYKGLSNYNFTTAYSSNAFTASMYNQTRTAINAMSPTTSVPSSVSTGDPVTAYGLNRLRDSLNSIT